MRRRVLADPEQTWAVRVIAAWDLEGVADRWSGWMWWRQWREGTHA